VGVSRSNAQALSWFERSADAGNVAAMIFAASMLVDNRSPLNDATRAVRW